MRYTDPSGNCVPGVTCPYGVERAVRQAEGVRYIDLTRVNWPPANMGQPNLPLWLGPLAAAEAFDPLPLDPVIWGLAGCILFCGDAADEIGRTFGTLFSGGSAPVEKGQRGVDEATRALEEMGYDVTGKEVTFELPDGKRIRVDIWAERDGKQIAIEVKAGKETSLRTRQEQSEKYTELEEYGGVPRGERAREAGLPEGEHVGDIEIEVVYVED